MNLKAFFFAPLIDDSCNQINFFLSLEDIQRQILKVEKQV